MNRFVISEKLNINTWGVDTAFKWKGIYATGEYLWGQAEGDESGREVRAQGYYVQAGYCIIPKTFELAMGYSWMDPNRDVRGDQLTEVAGAMSYYFNKHNLKIQADIANIHDQATGRADDTQYRLQTQIVF